MKTFEIGALSSLMSNVQVTDGCWLWTGDTNGSGYGAFSSGMFRTGAHRAMYVIMYDEEPDVVRHMCGNSLCVKPTHLRSGTQQQNMQDKFLHGTGNTQKLTALQVEEIRRRFRRASPRKSNASELAEEFGVTARYICRIADRRSLDYVSA